jgi:hypothetical protein
LIPKKILNTDTVYIETGIGSLVFFEVVAEDGTTITYHLLPSVLSSDAFVISNTYKVDQDLFRIQSIPGGTAVSAFFRNIEVVQGATATVLDKLGLERELGIMAYDDKLEVVSEDMSKRIIYYLDFIEETEMEVNMAPEVELSFSDTTILVGSTIQLVAYVTDDGNPVPPALTNSWETEVVIGDPAHVSIANPDQAITDATFSGIGTFKLNLTVSDGELSTEVSITVNVTLPEGVNTYSEPFLNMFPVPSTGLITIELLNMGQTESVIKIYDLTGKLVYNKQFTTSRINIDLSVFDAGAYFIAVKANEKIFTRRFHIVK